MNALEIKEIFERYGWSDLGPKKNPNMLSFRRKGDFTRLNYFVRTQNVTLQLGMFPTKTFREIDTAEKLEEVLNSIR